MFIEQVNRRSKAVKKRPLNGSIEEVRAIKECPQNGSINKGDGKISYWVSLGIRIHSRVRRVDVEQCHNTVCDTRCLLRAPWAILDRHYTVNLNTKESLTYAIFL